MRKWSHNSNYLTGRKGYLHRGESRGRMYTDENGNMHDDEGNVDHKDKWVHVPSRASNGKPMYAKSSVPKIYHSVHFSEKDKAKGEGMRWDPDKKKWYHTDSVKSGSSAFPKLEESVALEESLETGDHVKNNDKGFGIVTKHSPRFAHVKWHDGTESKHSQSSHFNKEVGFADALTSPSGKKMTKDDIQKKHLPMLDSAAERHGYKHTGETSQGEHIYTDSSGRHRATSHSASGTLIHHRLEESTMKNRHFRSFLDKHHEAMSSEIGSKEYHSKMADAYKYLAKHHSKNGNDTREKHALGLSAKHKDLSDS